MCGFVTLEVVVPNRIDDLRVYAIQVLKSEYVGVLYEICEDFAMIERNATVVLQYSKGVLIFYCYCVTLWYSTPEYLY